MIPDAVLYLAGPDDVTAARRSIAHRPLAFRVLMAAVRSGVTRVWLPEALRDPALERHIGRTPSARASVAWMDAAMPPPAGDVLFLPAGTLVTATALRPLVATKRTQMLDGLAHDAPVAATAAHVATGVWREIARGRAVGAELARALAVTSARRVPVAGVAARVDGDAAIPDAERRLYATLGSPIDSPLDRAFHRRLSLPLTRLAMAWGLAPNAISVVSIVVGLAGAVVLAADGLRGAVAGLALYATAVVLDHADGEVARLGFTESRVGEWLDLGCDTIVHAALVIAMGVACARATGRGTTLGLVAAVGVVASAWAMKTAPPATGRAAGVFAALGTRDGFYAMLVAFVLGTAFWPTGLPLLLLIVALGTHAYWVGSAISRARSY